MTHRSPIARLGYTDWKQYGLFKTYFRLPHPYLQVIVKNFPDLTAALPQLNRLVALTNQHYWKTMNDTTQLEKLCAARGVPASYIRRTDSPIAVAKTMKTYEAILENIELFIKQPIILHVYSGFENGALLATSQIIKAALTFNQQGAMVTFGQLLDETKTWDRSNHTVTTAETAQILGLYLVGKEWNTEFTSTKLNALLAQRLTDGKPTIISTHLDEKELVKRYDLKLPMVSMKFEDDTITATVDGLLKLLKERQ